MGRLVFGVGLALFIACVILAGCGDDSETDAVSSATPVEAERILLAEFKALLDSQADMVVVDVRSKISYDIGHIPGAISMPYPDDIRSRYEELPRDKTIVLYCC